MNKIQSATDLLVYIPFTWLFIPMSYSVQVYATYKN